MATRYHISDSGTPAVCRAKTIENCPKTKAGDGFHGDLAEAAAESEKRFEQSYGSTVTLSSKEKKDQWNRASHKLWKHAMEQNLYRKMDMGQMREHIAQGLAESHGVSRSRVTNDSGDPLVAMDDMYYVREDDGTTRVYGERIAGRGWTLKYLGVQHPKLKSRVEKASEHIAINLDTGEETENLRGNYKWFGYATADLDGHGKITFPVDKDGVPTTRQVWSFIDSSKLPKDLEEDEQLRAAIANGGVIKD